MTQLIETVGPHTITVTAEPEQTATPRHISYTILIDGFLFEQGQDDTDNGKYNEDDCTRYQLRNTAEMLEAGMLRRVGPKWQLAQNAEWPIPAGYRPEWPEDLEILFDNGGGALLMTPDYCHSYDDAEQLACDVHAYLNGSDPLTWDGNQSEYRRDRHPEDDVVTSADISRHLTEGTTTDHGGHTHSDFWTELHRLNTPDLASVKTASEKWLIFHRSQAGSPSAFGDASGLWHFEPFGPHGFAGVYSCGYPTREAAIAAAEQWEIDVIAERDQADVQEGR